MGAESHQTFVFADIAGFTALTEAHGDEEGADLAESFSAEAEGVVREHHGEHVKTIGDALMLRVGEPAAAVRMGLAIVLDLMTRHGSPAVRVGMHYGPAVERSGDWFGSTVNLAARVSGLAVGGEVLLSEAARRAAGEIEGVHFVERGRQRLRNVSEPMTLYAARRQGESSELGLPIDPVCRMAVDPEQAAGHLTHEKVDYYFCSLECAAAFAGAPHTHLAWNPRSGGMAEGD